MKHRPCRRTFILILMLACLPLLTAAGWDMTKHAIPLNQIMASSVPREGIPALTAPKFVPGQNVKFVQPAEPVIGVERNGLAKAYPLRILSWHELVNDRFGDQPVLISWCPLAYSGAAFSRLIAGKERTFGASGLLYRSNLLMFDRATESLWSQIRAEAVTGELTGTRLTLIPSVLTTWGKWLTEHPDTLVLSTDTGFPRDYTRDPYLDYYARDKGFWSFFEPAQGEKEKELVVGLARNGRTRAWPLTQLKKKGQIKDRFDGKPLQISYDTKTDRVLLRTGDGDILPHLICYWFVWKGIYSQTTRYASK